ncbi:MAG: hypothetical protein KC431_21020 [Myxococcales bacterium]|nr:hypothetical protein [Myxococcales bacterium]
MQLSMTGLLLLGACDKAGSTGTTTPGGGAVDPIEREGGSGSEGLAALAPALLEFVVVPSDSGLPSPLPRSEPTMLADFWVDRESMPPALATIANQVFGTTEELYAQAEEAEEEFWELPLVPVDPAALRAGGIEPPARQVWLIGPAGPCLTRVDQPLLGYYSWGLEVIELSWRLVPEGGPGCEGVSESWAPIGVIAEGPGTSLNALPAGLRWQGAAVVSEGRVAADEGPYAALLQAFAAEPREFAAEELWLRRREVGGTDLVELSIVVVDRVEPPPGEERNPCEDFEDLGVRLGLWRDGELEPLAIEQQRVDESALVGAVVLDGEVAWTVQENWGDAQIHVPARAEGQEPKTVRLPTGSYHPEEQGFHMYSVVEYCGP